MQGKLTYSFYFTLSKVTAIAILLIGTFYSLIYRDGSVMTTTILASGGLMGLKTGVDGIITASTNRLTNKEKSANMDI